MQMQSWSFIDELGALLTGLIVSTFLYGLGTLQTYIYFTKYPNDKLEVKLWVGAIWAIDTANIALVCHGLFELTMALLVGIRDGFTGHNLAADSAVRSIDISAGFNILAAILVQCFFVKRIYQLSPTPSKYWVTIVLSMFVCVHFALGSVAVVQIIRAFNGAGGLGFDVPFGSLTLSAGLPYTLAAVFSDVVIAIALTLLLRARRSDFESINSVIDKAVNFSLTRCVLVSIAAIVRLVTFAAVPGTLWFLAMDFIIGKLYAISLMSMLNSRRPPSSVTDETAADTAVFSTMMPLDVATFGQGSTHRLSANFPLASSRHSGHQTQSTKDPTDVYLPSLTFAG